MENVLYECSWKWDTSVMIPFLLLAAAIRALQQQKPKGLNLFLFCFMLIVSGLVSLFVVAEQIDQYNKIVLAYRKGDYQIVEGYVENFHPMPPQGHDTEHFEIGGLRFEYSDATVMQGYHTSRVNGGVITGDGQHLRIGYIVMDSATGNRMLDNVIVYIEALPEPSGEREDIP